MIWREKRILLAILTLLLLVNAGFFFTYRVQYENRLKDLDARRDDATRALKAARSTRLAAEQQFAAYQQVKRDVDEIYDYRWATQGERLAPLIIEVKRLAAASDLIPGSYAFSRGESKGARLSSSSKTSTGAMTVGIDFTVQGSYEQVRRLVNLLELSDQFVIIEELALSATSGNILSLNIGVKTLFRDDSQGAPANATTAGQRS